MLLAQPRVLFPAAGCYDLRWWRQDGRRALGRRGGRRDPRDVLLRPARSRAAAGPGDPGVDRGLGVRDRRVRGRDARRRWRAVAGRGPVARAGGDGRRGRVRLGERGLPHDDPAGGHPRPPARAAAGGVHRRRGGWAEARRDGRGLPGQRHRRGTHRRGRWASPASSRSSCWPGSNRASCATTPATPRPSRRHCRAAARRFRPIARDSRPGTLVGTRLPGNWPVSSRGSPARPARARRPPRPPAPGRAARASSGRSRRAS